MSAPRPRLRLTDRGRRVLDGFAVVASFAALCGLGVGVVLVIDQTTSAPPGPVFKIVECESDDGSFHNPDPSQDVIGCFWDAEVSGNRQGTSFIVLGGQTYLNVSNDLGQAE